MLHQKRDCLGFGLRTRNLWVKNSSHMELPACYSLTCKGGLWLNPKNRKIWGVFFRFLERKHQRKESEGIPVVFVQHLIKTPQMPIFSEGNVWLRIKCWVASDVSVNGHAIKALRELLKMCVCVCVCVCGGVPPEVVKWNNTLVLMHSVSHIEKGTFQWGHYVTSPRKKRQMYSKIWLP